MTNLCAPKEVTRDKIDSNKNAFTSWSDRSQIHQQISASWSHITKKDRISIASV